MNLSNKHQLAIRSVLITTGFPLNDIPLFLIKDNTKRAYFRFFDTSSAFCIKVNNILIIGCRYFILIKLPCGEPRFFPERFNSLR